MNVVNLKCEKKLESNIITFLFVFFLLITLTSCTVAPTESNDENAPVQAASSDSFGDFSNASSDTQSNANDSGSDPESKLESEISEHNLEKTKEKQNAINDLNAEKSSEIDSSLSAELESQTPDDKAALSLEEPPPPVIQDQQSSTQGPTQDFPADSGIQTITNIQFQANDSGSTIVITGTAPLEFSSKMNATNKQFVIEVPHSKLSNKLKRPFITKDFAGDIGAIDAYQNSNTNSSKIVVQLRSDANEPLIQSEGNSLLVVSSSTTSSATASSSSPTQDSNISSDITNEDAESNKTILSANSLEEFLAGDLSFRGKKISIESNDMEIKDLIQLIQSESGVNLIVSDEVKGKISVKLREVPWDQALVMILKSRKLGYTRVGSILRIAPMEEIKSEEAQALKLAADRRSTMPLTVKIIPVNFASINDLVTQVKPFLMPGGQVVGDERTSSLIVSDVMDSLNRITKLVKTIDIPPQQVLIEGKVVEAVDSFTRSIGVNWGMSGRPVALFDKDHQWTSTAGRVRMNSGFSINPGIANQLGNLSLSLGTLDTLGDLNASLAFYENEGTIKVISSPRIMAVHNEESEINQSSEIPLINSVLSPTTGVSQTNVTFKQIKLKLGVKPLVTNEGSIVMKIEVIREYPGTIVNEATQARPILSRAAKTKVLVRNGQTAVIGGIYQSDAQDSEDRVPGLGKIPIIGWLFKSSTVKKEKNELLIFLTPRIVKPQKILTANGDGSQGEMDATTTMEKDFQ